MKPAWDTMLADILLKFFGIGDAAVLHRATITLLRHFGKVSGRRLVTDCDIDFALGYDEIPGLIIAPTIEALFFYNIKPPN